MSCENNGLLLSKYIDEELTIDERKFVDDHIAKCQTCRETLAILLKNESILHSALAGEIFGNMVVDSVIRKVERGRNVVATGARKVGGTLSWKLIASVAAVLLIAVTVTSALTISNLNKSLTTTVGKSTQAVADSDLAVAHYREIAELAIKRIERDRHAIEADSIEGIRSNAHNARALASVTKSEGVTILANFEGIGGIHHYDIFRYCDGDKSNGEKINREGALKDPFYTDTSVRPGHKYTYFIAALKENGEIVASETIEKTMKDDGNIDEEGIEIKYVLTSLDRKTVSLKVFKRFDREVYNELFLVRPGETIGGKRYSSVAHRELDFTTRYRLVDIQNAEKIRTITIQVPVKDGNGLPVYNADGKQRYEYEERVVVGGGNGTKIVIEGWNGLTHEIWEGGAEKLP